MNRALEEEIRTSNDVIRKNRSVGYLAAAVIAIAISYVPGCGGDDKSCDSDKDCYNGQECKRVCTEVQDPCYDDITRTSCYHECVDKGETSSGLSTPLQSQEVYFKCD